MRAARRSSRALGAALVLAAFGWAPAASAGALVRSVQTVGMTVRDMDRSVAFFTDVLTFRKLSDVERADPAFESLEGVFGARARVVQLGLGGEVLELTEYLAPRGRAIPEDARSNDRTFQHVAIIVSDMAAAYKRLREHKVTHASSGPQRLPDWNKSAGGIEAFYFKDPDGHALEVLAFPKDKGAAKWHRPTDELFLGIDHTAIVVGDTETSLHLYRDTLGLVVAGESENYGTEQEHLNAVFGARLRITGLKAEGGPGIEFLEYLSPRDGRPAPADLKANDLAHWQTTLLATALETVSGLRQLFFVSPGVVNLGSADLGFRRAVLLRDPDGHALRLVEP
jgi:catechol 2,3-dioxygenase-like lactoylglutathione lyase family enzyme